MSIFNPWVILAFILAMITSFSGGYLKGGQDEFAKQQMEIARLNNEARQTEQALVTAVQKQATELVKANNNAKLVIQKRNLTARKLNACIATYNQVREMINQKESK